MTPETRLRLLTIMALVLLTIANTPRAEPQGRLGIEASSTESAIPIQFLAHLPTVNVKINDIGPYKMILDTGAAISVVDDDLRKALLLPIFGRTEVGSPLGGHPVIADSIGIHSIQIGNAVIRRVLAVALDLDEMLKPMDAPDGILALKDLAGLVVTLDYNNEQVLLRAGELPPANAQDVFGYDAAIPDVPLSLAGLPMRADLDTGSPALLSLPSDYISKLSLVSEPVVSGHGRTVDAEFEILSGQLDGDLTIGSIVIPSPKIAFNSLGQRAVIGSQLIRQFAVTFDPANQRFRFAPAP